MQRVIKGAVAGEADGEGALLCLHSTGIAHAVARDDSAPARFMFLVYLVDEAPGDPEASQILTVTRQGWDLHLTTVLGSHALKEKP